MCDAIIDYFFNNQDSQAPGRISKVLGSDIDTDFKKTTDMTCFLDDTFLSQNKFMEEIFNFIWSCVNSDYFEIFDYRSFSDYQIYPYFNIQQYVAPGGHFNSWHCEQSFNDEVEKRRVAVWMMYLNTLDEGQTEFFHQKKSVYPEKGKLLIWPSFYTHIHRGTPVKKKDKYIITGWITCTEHLESYREGVLL